MEFKLLVCVIFLTAVEAQGPPRNNRLSGLFGRPLSGLPGGEAAVVTNPAYTTVGQLNAPQGGARFVRNPTQSSKDTLYIWGNWGNYGGCSVSCGIGVRLRQRRCYYYGSLTPKRNTKSSSGGMMYSMLPLLLSGTGSNDISQLLTYTMMMGNGGSIFGRGRTEGGSGAPQQRNVNTYFTGKQGCLGSNFDSLPCTMPVCKAQCVTSWGAFGTCSASCGNAFKTRSRMCLCRNSLGLTNCSEVLRDTTPCLGLPTCIVAPTTKATIVTSPTTQSTKAVAKATWSNWQDWQECSVTCGGGVHERYRFCFGTRHCEGNDYTQSRPCNTAKCEPEYAQHGPWSTWGACSLTCGSGTRSRIRNCPGVCQGSSFEAGECNNGECSIYGWSQWTALTNCSAECGDGILTRFRTCEKNGAIAADVDLCGAGNSFHSVPCNLGPCVISTWGDWGKYSSCTTTCGPGNMTRFRVCNTGSGCLGASSETARCDNTPCDEKVGTWGEWQELDPCSATCGEGTRSRFRYCSIPGKCRGNQYEIVSCKMADCPQIVGVYSTWVAWGTCTKQPNVNFCSQQRTRSCLGPIASCVGPSSQTRTCSTGVCAPTTVATTTTTTKAPNQDRCDARNAEDRIDCGWKGITREECLARFCCYSDKIDDVNWCFHDDVSLSGVDFRGFSGPNGFTEETTTSSTKALPRDEKDVDMEGSG